MPVASMLAASAVAAHASRTMNCAQSILRAFQPHHAVSEERIAAARRWGGGCAPEGRCGALHAAMDCTPAVAERLRQDFIAQVGSESCRAIRRERRRSCEDCVAIAATLLAEAGRQP